jgi:hypothetical protein
MTASPGDVASFADGGPVAVAGSPRLDGGPLPTPQLIHPAYRRQHRAGGNGRSAAMAVRLANCDFPIDHCGTGRGNSVPISASKTSNNPRCSAAASAPEKSVITDLPPISTNTTQTVRLRSPGNLLHRRSRAASTPHRPTIASNNPAHPTTPHK